MAIPSAGTTQATALRRRSEDAPDVPPRADTDERPPSRRDHDRVFYSAEFARLEGVTQVATVTASGVHNRLTHSYRVEQVARSIALRVNRLLPDRPLPNGQSIVDEDAVAAASLGHDIGHSPFGHTGEVALQELLVCDHHREQEASRTYEGRRDGHRDECSPVPCILSDSFEGNAQSLRILARLAPRKDPDGDHGLDLTRMTLRAGLKYPWLKGDNPSKLAKWGAYDCDKDVVEWILNDGSHSGVQSLEAQIMDTADDIAYAVHDLEDFYKANVIPLSEVRVGKPVFEEFLGYISADPDPKKNRRLRTLADEYFVGEAAAQAQPLNDIDIDAALSENRPFDGTSGLPDDPEGDAMDTTIAGDATDDGAVSYPSTLVATIATSLTRLPERAYVDSVDGRAILVRFRSQLISQFIGDLTIDDAGRLVFATPEVETYMDFLKQLTWYYVINDPELNAIRSGQARVMRTCFDELYKNAQQVLYDDRDGIHIRTTMGIRTIPPRLLDYIKIGQADPGPYKEREVVARAVVDYLCSLTDADTYALAARINGSAAYSLPTSLGALRGG